MSTTEVGSELDALRARLCEQSLLFDHPTNYEAGVLDTLAAVTELLVLEEEEPA